MDHGEVTRNATVGIILAGGAGRRMGGRGKALMPLANKPLIEYVIANFAPQVGRLAISVHAQESLLERFGLSLIEDDAPARSGPTAGLSAGIAWCSLNAEVEWLALASQKRSVSS